MPSWPGADEGFLDHPFRVNLPAILLLIRRPIIANSLGRRRSKAPARFASPVKTDSVVFESPGTRRPLGQIGRRMASRDYPACERKSDKKILADGKKALTVPSW